MARERCFIGFKKRERVCEKIVRGSDTNLTMPSGQLLLLHLSYSLMVVEPTLYQSGQILGCVKPTYCCQSSGPPYIFQ